MAFSAPAFGVAAAVAAGAILKFESENVLNDGPSALVNPSPPGAVASVAQAIARQTCRRYADGVPGLSPDGALSLETVCRPYLDNIGYGTAPKVEKPFDGGQCDCARYQITVAFTNSGGTRTQTIVSRVRGPIKGIRLSQFSKIEVLCKGGVNSATAAYPPCGPEIWFNASGAGNAPGSSDYDLVIQQSPDGDACGNPPPEVIPPVPPPTPGPRIQPTLIVGFANVDIDVNILPDARIEINLGNGPTTIDPFADGDGDGGGGGGGGGAGDQTSPGTPGDVVSTGLGGEASGSAPDGQEIVGLMAIVTTAPPRPSRVGRTNRVVYRGIGYIRMGYEERLGVDVSAGVSFSQQFFHAQQRGLTHWRTTANIGFDLLIIPYYRTIEP